MKVSPRPGTTAATYNHTRFYVDYGECLCDTVQVRLDGDRVYLSYDDPRGLLHCELPIDEFGESIRKLILKQEA